MCREHATTASPASEGQANFRCQATIRRNSIRTSTHASSASTVRTVLRTDYAGLANYFKTIRAAFDDRSIRRGIVVAEANYIACQTWIEGTFVREFTQSPAGVLAPNGQRVVWDLANIFRFDDQERIIEEWVRTDYRSFLRQLGAPGK